MANEVKIQHRLGKSMLWVAWALILLLLVGVFQQWLNKLENPNQQPTSHLLADGVKEVMLQRNRYNQYISSGTINGHTVQFLVDTGATEVALDAKLAHKLGLRKGLQGHATTASGVVTTYATRLDTLSIGEIQLHDIKASIMPNMPMESVLLGMSALNDLEFTQRGDQLILRQYAKK